MTLATYRKKRRFNRTPEPRGSVKRSTSKRSFVIQKHDASHLHYDFRLELDGLMKSWAVPKGPSLDPKQKRLAVEVEDHPIEYSSFEGIIPEGHYGGGTVMIWDRGTWEAEDNAASGHRSGRLKFELFGEKLRGKWMLVRRNGRQTTKPQWLLFKLPDDEARSENKGTITDQRPNSVASGRTLEQIAEDRDREWQSNSKKTKTSTITTAASKSDKSAAARSLHKLKISKARSRKFQIPKVIELQLPTLVPSVPAGDDWFHELKLDGYRMLCRINGDRVKFETRNHLDWTAKLSALAKAAAELHLEGAVLDGEVVALDENGISQFQILQNTLHHESASRLLYSVFDMLFFEGNDLRGLSLEERKEKLASLKLPTDRGQIRYTEHLVGKGIQFFEEAQARGLEGIVSKRRDRPYVGGRGTDWLKIKCQQHAEFVIGGYTDPSGARHGFGALLLGYFEGNELKYAGRVGTGFSDQTLADLLGQLKRISQSESPFADYPVRSARGVHWVKPKLVAQVRFSNWTQDNLLRQPAFQGLREDKPARAIGREVPKPLSSATKSANRNSKSKQKRVAAKDHDKAPAKNSSGHSTPDSISGVRVTHPEKVFYPKDGITKRDLAEYYVKVADTMLPYVVDRPLAIVRCPDGIEGERFFQKHPGMIAPDELRQVEIKEKSGKGTYLVIDDVQGLVALAQIGALEIHIWGARADRLEKPDQIVLDLDPAPDVEWPHVIAAATELREFLKELGLESFVKTSGGKGLHLVMPIERRREWPEIADFSHQIAHAIERAAPDRYVANMSKKRRTGKIFVDYLRNQRGSTYVAPFSTRARAGAPVSMPISWRELLSVKDPAQFTLPDVLPRLRARRTDPWKGFSDVKQSITNTMIANLSKMLAPSAG